MKRRASISLRDISILIETVSQDMLLHGHFDALSENIAESRKEKSRLFMQLQTALELIVRRNRVV